jgi:DNA-binding NtrC family response regulator
MHLSNVSYHSNSAVTEHVFLNDRVEALRSLLNLVQREIESLDQLASVEEKQIEMENEEFSLTDEVERFEADLIRLALIKTGGHQRKAARLLGINATTLNIKIKRYGIDARINNMADDLIT